jgi:4-amino-4-deoxy-L-arabinose transferase-like glycosyltransferase
MQSPAPSRAELVERSPKIPRLLQGRQARVIAVILLWAVIYIPGLFSPPLLDDADSVHAEAAREILVRNDWVTLHANGIRYLEKAPLLYWSMAASFKLFGVSEWAARLPLTLGILALLLVCYALGKRAYSAEAGLYAAVIMATGFGPYIFTRILIPDLLVALWLALGFLFFLRTLDHERPSRLECWGLAASAALNVLTKGLIGLVFPAVIIAGYLALTSNLKHLLKLRLLSSSAVFLLIAAPWHILAGIRNPGAGAARGFFWFYFINEHFLRYLNKRVPRDYDTVPLLVFWGLALAWLLPWSAFIIQAVAQAIRRLRSYANSKEGHQAAGTLLFAVWAVVIVGFFSFSTRQEYYTVPALPALALLIGAWLAEEAGSPANSLMRRAGRISSAALLLLGTIAFLAAMLLLQRAVPPAAGYDLADLLKKNPDEYALSFGHIFDLTPRAMGAFRAPLLICGCALLIGTAANWLLRRRGAPRVGNLALALMMIAVLGCVHAGLVTFSPILQSRQLAMAIKQVYRPGDVIIIDGEYESGSTLNFYTGQQVHVLNGRSANLWYGSLFPDAPAIFENDASFEQRWTGSGRVFFFSDKEHPKPLEGKIAYELARNGGKRVFVNQPVVTAR